jgi:hypothetical protein
MVRHVLRVRQVSDIGTILGLGKTSSQGSFSTGASGGSVVSTGRVGGNVDRDALTVVWASEMGHGGGRAGQSDHTEAEEVCKLHYAGWGTGFEDR